MEQLFENSLITNEGKQTELKDPVLVKLNKQSDGIFDSQTDDDIKREEFTVYHPKSEYKVPEHYNRNRLQIKAKPKKNAVLKEKLILQCIVCGVILAVVLCFNFIRTDEASNINVSLKNILSENMTWNEVKSAFSGVSKNVLVFGETVKSVLGFEKDESLVINDVDMNTDIVENVQPYEYEDVLANESTEEVVERAGNESDIVTETFGERIDEDILFEINNRIDSYNN